MLLIWESIVLCLLFTLIVFILSRDPIKTVYNYPPKIQERVKQLDEYKDSIPTKKNKVFIKIIASIIFLVIICVVLRYVNGYITFIDSFKNGLLLWTVVNLYDAVVLDIIWFCHDKHFVIKGTEDMVKEYHNYMFHIKGFIVGEILALVICTISSAIIHFIL